MKLAIFGGTGQTGAHLVARALAAGDSVTVLARTPAAITTKHERLAIVQGDATKLDDCARAIAGADVVISALGPPARKPTTVRTVSVGNMVAAMKQQGVQKIVWLSASGVGDSLEQAKRSSFVFGGIIIPLLLKATYADAKAAEDLLAGSGLVYVIARPVGLTNKALRGNVEGFPLSDKLKRISIPRADVAAWMLARAKDTTCDRQCVSIC